MRLRRALLLLACTFPVGLPAAACQPSAAAQATAACDADPAAHAGAEACERCCAARGVATYFWVHDRECACEIPR